METCEFQTVAWNGEHHPYSVTLPCGKPATHRLDVAIAGASSVTPGGELGRRFFYCCGHNVEAVAEIDADPTITIRNDVIEDASVRTELAERDGGWQMRLHVKHHGQAVEFPTPWMRLAATTEHGATLEAAARSAAIQTNVMGDHQ